MNSASGWADALASFTDNFTLSRATKFAIGRIIALRHTLGDWAR